MCKQYNCLPTDLWPMYDPISPKGFYFNRGTYYFGRMVESAMDAAEAGSRNGRKPSKSVDALVRAARLRALEIHLGTKIRRHRDPGGSVAGDPNRPKEKDKGVSEIVMSGF